MPARAIEGAALLVAAHGADDASTVHALGQIGEALLAGGGWKVRRLVATDRASLKRQLDELAGEPVRAGVVVIAGEIEGDAVVTGENHREYPEDTTLKLHWIRDRLRGAKAEQLVVVMAGRGGGANVDALATGRAGDVVATGDDKLVDALLAGLCGDALDPKTGTVTMRSISEHLARAGAAVRGSERSETLATAPPLGGLFDVRRSMLSVTHPRPRAAAGDDLTGIVLPGRFRVDAIVAKGTFGTVYRAHQLSVERDVAVKVLNAEIDPSSDDGRLFVHEIRSVGRIDHANVVRIYQADITYDGRLFFAMELLDGQDLQAVGVVGTERAVCLVRQLLEGLGAAHDAGLVHADVKPANAIVTSKDRVVLVDFGLARLRAPDRAVESAGGTPAYMAPEQLHEGRVDARSDLFSAALVLVNLLTGWRRPNAFTIVPPMETIPAELRGVVEKALAIEPAGRYQSARELAAALGGEKKESPAAAPVKPFRQFAPLTERDRMYGREADVAALVDHVLYRRCVIYTAPSGTGKTSLLRAGLVPRLEALGVSVVYFSGRDGGARELERAIGDGKVTLVLDQIEAAVELVEVARKCEHVVLSVREDHLARLVGRVEAGVPIVRLPPLDRDGARAAIVGPLTEARLEIAAELLEELLGDLARAAAALAPELGWEIARTAAYPPHLQLACSVLFEALGSGEKEITVEHYRRLGGFDAIVGEHLERVLDVELAGGRDAVAKDLFVALVTSTNERAMRPEAELVEMCGARAVEVLELLRERGLVVRARDGWELAHDSLVPRVLAWVDRRDLARRKAVELVRYHTRRGRLLGRKELREVRPYGGAIAELDRDWRGEGEKPVALVARSRRAVRQRMVTVAAVAVAAVAVTGGAVVRMRIADARERRETSLKERDLGRFRLELAPFDWSAKELKATPVRADELPELGWELRYPDESDADAPGAPYAEEHVVHGAPSRGAVFAESVEARGGRAFLAVTGRARRGERACGPSIVPLVALPGYREREAERTLAIRIPTCAATREDTIEIPAGPFIFGGPGEPPSKLAAQYRGVEQVIDLPAYRIDRTEVTNAVFAQLAGMRALTGIAMPSYPNTPELAGAGAPSFPVTEVTWSEARALCRFFGKELPTSQQWEKAMRGGLRLADGSENPMPRRNLPWGNPIEPVPARLLPADRVPIPATPVGSSAGDRSPYSVLDMAGNVMEWSDSLLVDQDRSVRVARGGSVFYSPAPSILDHIANENPHGTSNRDFGLGVRCRSSTLTEW